MGNFDFSMINIKHDSVDKDYLFYGSYYRGMLGRNLKRRFCIQKDSACETCVVSDKCLYMLSFEKYKDSLFLPYVINRCSDSELRITLIGVFSKFSEAYIKAFERELKIKRAGFYDPFEDTIQNKQPILNSQMFKEIKARETFEVEINFGRFKRDSKVLDCDKITFDDIIKAVERRIYLINKFYGKEDESIYINEPFEAKMLSCQYYNIKRYSNRKQKSMSIPSLKIKFFVKSTEALYKYFYLASFFNIGTNASMGFGQLYVY